MRKFIAVIMLFSFVACATPNKTYIAGLKATNESITFVATKAKDMCGKEQLSETDCARIKLIYGQVKQADDAVIDITQASIVAGQKPEENVRYQVAMDKLISAMSQLLDLAAQLNIIGGQ